MFKCKCIKRCGCFVEGREYEYERLKFKNCDYNYKVINPDNYALIQSDIFSWKEFKKHFDSEEKTERERVRNVKTNDNKKVLDKNGQGSNIRNRRKVVVEHKRITIVKVQKQLGGNSLLIYDERQDFIFQGENKIVLKQLHGENKAYFKAEINMIEKTVELISKVQDCYF